MGDVAKFERAIAVIIYSWTALSLAVEHQWGGPESDDKRAWVAGIVANMFHGFIFFYKKSANTSREEKYFGR